MPKNYHHLTYDQRCQIDVFLKKGFSQKEIAKELKVSQATISRELQRNSGSKGYKHKQAEEKAKGRRTKVTVALD